MNGIASKVATRAAMILVGLAFVALAMSWSVQHPRKASMSVEARSFSVGTTRAGDYQRHSWVIRNDGTIPLKLRTRFTSRRCGFSLWLGEDHFLGAGGLLTVSLTLPTPAQATTPFSEYADVVTDDPETPRVRFRVFGITEAAVH